MPEHVNIPRRFPTAKENLHHTRDAVVVDPETEFVGSAPYRAPAHYCSVLSNVNRCNRTRQRPGPDNKHTIWSFSGPEILGLDNDIRTVVVWPWDTGGPFYLSPKATFGESPKCAPVLFAFLGTPSLHTFWGSVDLFLERFFLKLIVVSWVKITFLANLLTLNLPLVQITAAIGRWSCLEMTFTLFRAKMSSAEEEVHFQF